MRKDFGPKTYLFPMPVLIIGTFDENGIPDAMNAAWGGIYDTNKVTISMGEHKTTDNLRLKGEFTLAFATPQTEVVSDYLGIVSAKQIPNKIERSGLTYQKAPHVDAPLFDAYPLALECKADSLEDGTLIASIINVSADESVLDESGNIDVDKLEFIAYEPSSHHYMLVKGAVGKAFFDGKNIH